MNLKKYLSEITEIWMRGDAREETWYPTLKTLIIDYTHQKFRKPVAVTVLPKKTVAGNPDFRIWDGENSITGYIEAKVPGTNLDFIEETEQIQRYLETFPNVILTNFLEFRLYRDGMEIDRVTIGRWNNIKTLKTAPAPEHTLEFESLFERFMSYSFPAITSAEELAKVLAQRTKFLRDEIIKIELPENEDIKGFYDAFKKYLISDLTEDDFADLYSQTITYGLFTARFRAGSKFNRISAYNHIPKTIGILRDIFGFVSRSDLPKQMETIIDDIAGVLAVTDVKLILEQYYRSGKGSDPIIHFYETFIEKYDPLTREKRGVYYTPEPVVDFMVRSVNVILKEKFGISAGLADKNVTLLDPAGGTLSFFTRAMEVAVNEYVKLSGEGMKKQFIKQQLLKNFYAFELMMAPYAIGHIKTSFMLEELGYQIQDDDRVQYFLTNTLEMEDLDRVSFPGLSSLSKESHLAGEVKKNTKIQIVIGNPPYSGHSSNNSTWIRGKIRDYFFVDGVSIKVKNSKWLQDDYVKFIRFAQHKIDQAGEGVVCLITNHSYLDNPTFKGMRWHLQNTFSDIYILDLHGNSMKNEISPDGSKDENVFNIKQGVSIAFFIKRDQTDKHESLYFEEIFGTREKKFDFLNKNDFTTITWRKINYDHDEFILNGSNRDLSSEFNKFKHLDDIFIKSNVGLYTGKDKFTINFSKSELLKKIKTFLASDEETIKQIFQLKKDSDNWSIAKAKKDLLSSDLEESKIREILYRPFDLRFTYYTGKTNGFMARPRTDIMSHLLNNNLALAICSQWGAIGSSVFDAVFVSKHIIDLNLFRRGGEMVYPLYLYTDPNHLFPEKINNIKAEFISEITEFYRQENGTISPESIFGYIYGILHSLKYRNKFTTLLKTNLPRIPFITEYEAFSKLSLIGNRLISYHLLDEIKPHEITTKYEGNGTNEISNVYYENYKIYINEVNYFFPISEQIFEQTIGGYRVVERWLKERKEKELTIEEVQTYCKIVTALEKTIELQKEIDEVIEI